LHLPNSYLLFLIRRQDPAHFHVTKKIRSYHAVASTVDPDHTDPIQELLLRRDFSMKRARMAFIACLLLLTAAAPVAFAVPTEITIRVKTKDAKFLGTSMGGALVTIKDVQTGEMLAKGLTSGGTGNTERIMRTPVARGAPVSDESAAAFTTTLDIDEPRLIEVSAYGPVAELQSANRVSATQWVVPGKHITGGDAWMMELPGFVVNVLAPPTHMAHQGVPQSIKINANILMM
jgi:hypothetical protein